MGIQRNLFYLGFNNMSGSYFSQFDLPFRVKSGNFGHEVNSDSDLV